MARNITDLHPRLQQKVAELKTLCEREGLILGIGECFRSVAEQDALYAQGRTKPGSIVTNAKGSTYSSQHQWGIAFDFFKNVKGHAYDDAAFFEKVGALAKTIGLAWGGDWKGFVDRPHLYLPDWGSDTSALKSQYSTFENFKKTWEAATAPSSPKKSVEELAKEVLKGQWGNGNDRINRLTAAGYDYKAVQAKVNAMLTSPKPTPSKKSVDEIAQEVINGKWGNGNDRKTALQKAGYDYAAVQAKVNALLKAPKKPSKTLDAWAKEVIAGKHGTGHTARKASLKKAGCPYDYEKVRARVNALLK